MSLAFAAFACGCMILGARSEGLTATLFFVGAACGVQLRLVCNLLDGMVAVEGGLGSATGDLYNEIPDRIADPAILVALGYAASWWWCVPLGWLAGVLSVETAYVRVLGGSLGLKQDFAGPMAKPHRMAVATVALLVEAGLVWFGYRGVALAIALILVVVGSIVTLVRRTVRIARGLGDR